MLYYKHDGLEIEQINLVLDKIDHDQQILEQSRRQQKSCEKEEAGHRCDIQVDVDAFSGRSS